MTTTASPAGASRRRAGTILITWGVAGLVLNGALAVGAATVAFNGIDGFDDLGDAVNEIVTIVDSTQQALLSGSVTLGHLSESVDETSAMVATASGVTGDLGDALGSIGTVAEAFDVFGQKPFALVAGPATTASTSLGDLGTSLTEITTALHTNAADLADLSARTGDVATSLQGSRDRLATLDVRLGPVGSTIGLVALLVLAWLLVPAIAAIVVGRRWRRGEPTAS